MNEPITFLSEVRTTHTKVTKNETSESIEIFPVSLKIFNN